MDYVLQDACQVRITAPVAPDRFLGGEVRVDLSDPAELASLRSAMSVKALPGYVCACGGDVRFEFLDADDRTLAVVVLHHGESLRWDGWEGNALLVDGHRILHWLKDHDVPGPLRQLEEAQREEKGRRRAEADWRAAVPTALDDLTDRLVALAWMGTDASPELLDELKDRLRIAFPDSVSRVLALLAWFGAGTGRYSGYPVYEDVPDLLLKDTPIAEIIAGLQDPGADSRHYAGALRHLVGWKSRRKQQRDIARLPEAVRLRLLNQAHDSTDRIPLRRAERWLAPRQAT
ncbi:hypothetical protein ABT040_28895 [Streptomyces sp. NPDC002688]|uniref:hypothetical protein n=1 Tax=Streptomyces sp. NPDC002688 TaxID=3154423 RepID=UPI00332CF7EB